MNISLSHLEQALDDQLERLVQHQQRRVYLQAQALVPNITEEDLLQPHQFPVLRTQPEWNYEDGVLAGMRAAQMALRAWLRSQQEPTP